MRFIYRTPTLTLTSDEWFSTKLRPAKSIMKQIKAAYPSINILRHEDYPFDLYNVSAGNEFIVADEADMQLLELEYPWMKELFAEGLLTEVQAAFNFMFMCRKSTKYAAYTRTHDLQDFIADLCQIDLAEESLIRGALLSGFKLEPLTSHGQCELNVLFDPVFGAMLRVLKSASDVIGRRDNELSSPDTIPFRLQMSQG